MTARADLASLFAGLTPPGRADTHYQARVRVDLPPQLLAIGGRGEAKVAAERITLRPLAGALLRPDVPSADVRSRYRWLRVRRRLRAVQLAEGVSWTVHRHWQSVRVVIMRLGCARGCRRMAVGQLRALQVV